MKRLAMVLLLAASGCGGTEPDYLLGSWLYDVDSKCSVGASFAAGNEYVLSMICTNGPRVEMDMLAGGYSVADGTLYMTANRSTCPHAAKFTTTEKISVSETSMVWTESFGPMVFRRVAGIGTGSAIFGCFDFGKGTFTPSPLAPI